MLWAATCGSPQGEPERGLWQLKLPSSLSDFLVSSKHHVIIFLIELSW